MVLDRTTYIHAKQPTKAQMITGACSQMIVESRAQTNRHMELQARMIME